MAVNWIAPKGTSAYISFQPKQDHKGAKGVKAASTRRMPTDVLKSRCQAFAKQFGLPEPQFNEFRLDVFDQRWSAILRWLADPAGGSELSIDSCFLNEPEPQADGPESWFLMKGHTSHSSIPDGVDFCWFNHAYLVSERTLQFIRSSTLRGLEDLPLVEQPKGSTIVWNEIFATAPLGRMMDHLLIDPKRFTSYYRSQGASNPREFTDPKCRWGQAEADRRLFHTKATFTPPLILSLLTACTGQFIVRGPLKAVAEHLPDADFAYFGSGTIATEREHPAGTRRSGRRLCCSFHARNRLLASGFMKPEQFQAIEIVPVARAAAAVLDRTIKSPLPLPAFTSAEAIIERSRRELRRKQLSTPAPKAKKIRTLPPLLEDISRRLSDPSSAWKPVRDLPLGKKIGKSKLLGNTPSTWRTLLPLLPVEVWCAHRDFEFEVTCPELASAYRTGLSRTGKGPHPQDIVIGCTGDGDWFAIRPSDPQMPQDAAVTHWSHETKTEVARWANVCEFVSHVLASRDIALHRGEHVDFNT